MISLKDLLRLPVETTSGLRLGRVVDAEVDHESHLIVTYVVQPGRLTRPLARTPLRINRSQVVTITKEKMVVDDSATTATSDLRSRGAIAKNAPSPISARIGS